MSKNDEFSRTATQAQNNEQKEDHFCFFHFVCFFLSGPPPGAMLDDFISVLDPKSHQKRCRKRSRKTFGFLISFLLVFSDFGDLWGALWLSNIVLGPPKIVLKPSRRTTFLRFSLPRTNFAIFGANFRNCG